MVGERSYDDQVVELAEGRGQASGQRGNPRHKHAVVIGDQDAHCRGSNRVDVWTVEQGEARIWRSVGPGQPHRLPYRSTSVPSSWQND